ncbi:uncharacterized protein LOC119449503 isoform X20 [Dermacentor silvarum]|uniref:uncharacterized protein LOC119449503 isoform X16 n=1 Tax=Dermacentor silvarum TaxID=543639 RepID=UPI002100CB22|nr:uncharacterized protein LOC119449503 isoform X16 [Dermacentor silvarum]XP_049521221.1 uncharacterized protein LOC119449503 isoform X17 [Dermacentor silvarum]XP_049521222.1 uncharacterized protein LOC119449503 isoform X18 [Dermacentor silvarum]XP_049521224.1 uncharacterized protein LOC119449503 isoform X19 [Dermacentor silvarum]XP_049521225.1 uncharacterized protein LOC119449503 isoform X20 [Dermacentor silvarum]
MPPLGRFRLGVEYHQHRHGAREPTAQGDRRQNNNSGAGSHRLRRRRRWQQRRRRLGQPRHADVSSLGGGGGSDQDDDDAPPTQPAPPRRRSAMKGAAVITFSVLLHLCGPLWLGASGVVRNRTEDLPIVFPDDDNVASAGDATPLTTRTARRLPDPPFVRSKGIPDSILFRMRDVKNLTDFVSQFLEGYPDATVDGFEGPPSILGKKGPVGGSSASVPNPEPGTCLPTKQLVEFPKSSDPSIILWPPCTRVPRCGGCCPSTILKCAPTKTTNVTFKVIKAQYPEPGASKFNFVGHEIVTLEKHDKCSCECKEKPTDCNALQQYNECRCVCRNNNEMLSCNGPGMVWDPRDCRCKCRDYAECSTGFYYNTRSCRCEQLGRSRIAPRIRQPLPRLYAPYTDNRENVQSRSYRNLDLFIGDDYSRPYTDAEHAPTVRRDLSTKITTTSRSSSSSATTASPSAGPPRSPQRSTAMPWSSTQRLNATTAVSTQSTSRSQGAA